MDKKIEEPKEKDFSFNAGNMINNSNEALVGDFAMIANDSWSQHQN